MTTSATRPFVVAVALVVLSASPASADVSQDGGAANGWGDGHRSQEETATGADAEGSAVRAHGSSRVPERVTFTSSDEAGDARSSTARGEWVRLTFDTVVDDGNGGWCRATGSALVSPQDAEAAQRRFDQDAIRYDQNGPDGLVVIPPCPPGTIDTIDVEPALAFADEVISQLPAPQPSINGERAITGLRTWLDTARPGTDPDSPMTRQFRRRLDLQVAVLPVTITAKASYVVDWGDGTTTGPHDVPGGLYHDGQPGPDDVTHTYVDLTTTNQLTVTDSWVVTVEIPGEDPIILDTTTTPVTLEFPINEVRSVRNG